MNERKETRRIGFGPCLMALVVVAIVTLEIASIVIC